MRKFSETTQEQLQAVGGNMLRTDYSNNYSFYFLNQLFCSN